MRNYIHFLWSKIDDLFDKYSSGDFYKTFINDRKILRYLKSGLQD